MSSSNSSSGPSTAGRSLISVDDRMKFLQEPLYTELTAHITGNAPPEIKDLPVKWLMIYRHRGNSFAFKIAERMKVVDVSIVPNVDDPLKKDGRVIVEIEVTPGEEAFHLYKYGSIDINEEDMCDATGTLNNGCKVFLIDECSATALTVINAFEGHSFLSGVSQNISTVFHAPATVGTKLRIVSRSLTSGYAMNSCRSDIWDTANDRLVASGTQIMMEPSMPMGWM